MVVDELRNALHRSDFHLAWEAVAQHISGHVGAYRKDDPVAAAERGDLSEVHYVFTGWNTEADGSGTAYAENAAFGFPYADRDLTLYGMWQRVTFTVTYMLDKGDENGYTEYRKGAAGNGQPLKTT